MTSAADARIVAIGGGHGLAASLRALKRITPHITAIVSVADDGGSSGRLRASHEQAAPGDIRKCLLALADESTVFARAVAYRFTDGDLDGHAFGNLLLSALNSVCHNLPDAVDAAGELLRITGRVLPATMEAVELVATTFDGAEVRGQVEVMATRGIDRVRLEPTDCRPPFSAHDAVEAADLVLLGPGSLYTSVLAAAVSPGLVEAIEASSAPLVYVCNLHPQRGESEGYTVADHVDALNRHGISPDVVLYDQSTMGGAEGIDVARAVGLADRTGRAHDAEKLAYAVRDIFGSLKV